MTRKELKEIMPMHYIQKAKSNKPRNYKEDNAQGKFISDFKEKWPGVHIRRDGAGNNKTHWQRNQQQKQNSGRGFPDIMIFASRDGFGACLIESKREGVNPILKNGNLSAQHHFRTQYQVHLELRAEGYYVMFASGEAELSYIADQYMNGTPVPMPTVDNFVYYPELDF